MRTSIAYLARADSVNSLQYDLARAGSANSLAICSCLKGLYVIIVESVGGEAFMTGIVCCVGV